MKLQQRAALDADLDLREAGDGGEDAHALRLDLRDDAEVAEKVAQVAQHRHRRADDVEAVAHRAPEGDEARADPVALRLGILNEVALLNEGLQVAEHAALRRAERFGERRHADRLLLVDEMLDDPQREDDRLHPRLAISGDPRHPRSPRRPPCAIAAREEVDNDLHRGDVYRKTARRIA